MAETPVVSIEVVYNVQGRAVGYARNSRVIPTEENAMTMTDPHTAAANEVQLDIDTIDQALDHLRRVAADRATRQANAMTAGATLAYEVEKFLGDPEGVGTDALRAAWQTFMGRHSGNFTDSVMAATRE